MTGQVLTDDVERPLRPADRHNLAGLVLTSSPSVFRRGITLAESGYSLWIQPGPPATIHEHVTPTNLACRQDHWTINQQRATFG